jgi:hypothetical protein
MTIVINRSRQTFEGHIVAEFEEAMDALSEKLQQGGSIALECRRFNRAAGTLEAAGLFEIGAAVVQARRALPRDLALLTAPRPSPAGEGG